VAGNYNIQIIKMKESEEIIQALLKFRNDRDWEQFHNSKDLALAISIESAELLELFLWKKAEDVNTEKVKEELADIFSFAFLLAEKYGFDVREIVLNKIKTNGDKYPIDKAKGTSKKYDEL
jgi:NTP pyrophosphatase (non-canonical NTP hydrolase)